jgi:N-formylglutamate amidohydrolase
VKRAMMTSAHSFRRFIVLLLICGAARAAFAAEPDNLVIARTGNLPILLTVPHGGLEAIPGVPVRSRGITGTDAYTIELAEGLAKHLENALGAQPYVVATRFSRKFIDANRPEAEAFESPDAKPAYDAYHNRIRFFIAQIKERFPRGAVLLDIHGQSGDPDALHRGTQNGATVADLLRSRGPAALTGPNSILGVVQSKGYKVFPPNTTLGNPPEDRRYNGGYTVRTYGSSGPEGLDAFQLEVGRDLRRDAQFIAALGEAVVVFYKAYLDVNPLPRAAASTLQIPNRAILIPAVQSNRFYPPCSRMTDKILYVERSGSVQPILSTMLAHDG